MSRTPEVDRQREHQANERTFLAWLRTSITLISFGLVLARFGIQQISSKQSTRVVPGYRSSQVATVLHQAEIRCISASTRSEHDSAGSTNKRSIQF